MYPNGSRYVCNPPVFGTDIDFLVYVDGYTEAHYAEKDLKKAGYVISSGDQYIRTGYPDTDIINCFRKGIINVVLTCSYSFTKGHVIATHLVKKYNIREKLDRVSVYEALRGNWQRWYENGLDRYPNMPAELRSILDGFNGVYGGSLKEAFIIKHRLEV